MERYCAEIYTLGGCCVKGVQSERMLCEGVQVGRMKSCLMAGDVLTSIADQACGRPLHTRDVTGQQLHKHATGIQATASKGEGRREGGQKKERERNNMDSGSSG